LRRLSVWSLDRLVALERMARLAFLEGVPPNDVASDERSDSKQHNGPDAQPELPT
jgi:hypothetical protein